MHNRIVDYEVMFQNQELTSDHWLELNPTNRRFLNGFSWYYFTPNTVRFLLKNNRCEVLEDKIYYRHDDTMRDLRG